MIAEDVLRLFVSLYVEKSQATQSSPLISSISKAPWQRFAANPSHWTWSKAPPQDRRWDESLEGKRRFCYWTRC